MSSNENLWKFFLGEIKKEHAFTKKYVENFNMERSSRKTQLLHIEILKKEYTGLSKLLSKGLFDSIPDDFEPPYSASPFYQIYENRKTPFKVGSTKRSPISLQLDSYKKDLNELQIDPRGKQFLLDSFLMYWKIDYEQKKKHNDYYGVGGNSRSGFANLEKPPRKI